MTSNPSIFIDTAFFKALADPDDTFNGSAVHTWNQFKQDKQNHLVTSNFILDESYTVLRMKGNKKKAFLLRDILLIASHQLQICRVLAKDEAEAWNWFENDWKGLSFTDCVTFAQMKRLGIRSVATFDDHFKKAGFHVMSM